MVAHAKIILTLILKKKNVQHVMLNVKHVLLKMYALNVGQIGIMIHQHVHVQMDQKIQTVKFNAQKIVKNVHKMKFAQNVKMVGILILSV